MTVYTNKKTGSTYNKMQALEDGRVELKNEFETFVVAASTFKRWYKKEIIVDMPAEPVEEPVKEEAPKVSRKSPRKVTVDFTKSDKELTNKQAEAYQKLIKELPIWDAAKSTKAIDINLTTTEEGTLVVKSTIVTTSGEVRNRELYIGRNGGITAFGKKTHSKQTKLMRAITDVMKYGYQVEV